jgi:hypothetical protein
MKGPQSPNNQRSDRALIMLVAGGDANAMNVAAVLGSSKRGGQLTHRLFRRKAGQKEPLSWLCVGISWRRKLRVLVRRNQAIKRLFFG